MRKYLAWFICFLAVNSVLAEENVLNVYAWSGYLSENVIQQFEKETGIRINHSTYINNEILYAKLKANPYAGYDIAIPSTYFISRMIKQNLLQKIDKSKIKSLKNIDPNFLNKEYDVGNSYSVPYLWNATGIAINKKYHLIDSIKSWKDLWDSRYENQLLVLDDTRELFSVALMVLGFPVNDTNPDNIRKAFEKLKSLMSNIKLFNTDAQRSIYLDEDITLGMAWNGDIYLAQQENPNLHLIYPDEGFVISLDCLVIPKGALHVENAHRFINFILRPEIAKQVSLDSGFSTPNQAALKLLPESISTHPVLYPSARLMKKGKLQAEVGNTATVYEKYFEQLKLEN